MSTLVPIDSDRYGTMEKVADLKMQGYTDTAVARELGVQRKVVLELFADYREMISRDAESRDIARDHLNLMVKHYDSLIGRYYDLIEEMDAEIGGTSFSAQWAAQKNSALKEIAALEAKRLDALQKAGLLDAGELGDELADMEEKKQQLIEILRNELCPECKAHVARLLQEITKQPEIVQVYNE